MAPPWESESIPQSTPLRKSPDPNKPIPSRIARKPQPPQSFPSERRLGPAEHTPNPAGAGSSRSKLRACLKMGRGSAAGEFWVGQGGERRGRPPAVCSARTNAVQPGKTRRPEGLGGKGPLAALLVGHRPLRVCSLLAPSQSNPSLPNRTPPHFQTGSLKANKPIPSRIARKPLLPRASPANGGSVPRSTPPTQPERDRAAVSLGSEQTHPPRAQRENPNLPRASPANGGSVPRSTPTQDPRFDNLRPVPVLLI